MNNIVLVHGGFVDGAGWEGVYKILKGHGYKVSIVQNPTISLEDDIAVTKRILATQDGPTILVGHSYVSQPRAVADLIEQAATKAKGATA